MTEEEVKTILLEIMHPYIPEEISIEDVTEEKDLINDLEINSSHIIDIILGIEDRFGIVIEDDAISKMDTMKDAIDLILEKISY